MLNRRTLLRNALPASTLSAAAVLAGTRFQANASESSKDVSSPSSPPHGQFREPARDIPVCDDADVIVCGGGPAGVSAAVSAARAGARVRLFEMHGSLGGVWTSGLLTYIFDFDKSALGNEIIERLDRYDARRCKSTRNFVYEPELMKLVCEEMATESKVRFQLHTPVVAAYRDPSGRNIETIVTESKSGRQAWQAPVFIDTTGDGDLAALAGCGFDMGSGPEGFGQPATLNALAVVRDASQMQKYISNDPEMWAPGGHGDSYRNFLAEIKRTGLEPSYYHPTLFKVHDNLLMIMINHEYKVRADDAAAVSAATVRARSEILRIVAALNKLGGVWEGMRVAATAEQIGIRCGRRIHGLYTITKEDVAAGRRFDDAVTESRFGVDIHASDFESNKKETIGRGGIRFRPFQIPLRSLIAKDADNLFMAGRCISGDFVPHGSYRVTGSAVAMGEAIGVHAAKVASQAGVS